jgi:glycosyltransferase involved in cell wall biosynthesis
MACGCAVVCTDIGGHRDYAIDGKTALLVRAKDSVDIKSKLITLIKDDNLRMQIAKDANIYLQEHFTWERSVSMLEEYFEKC